MKVQKIVNIIIQHWLILFCVVYGVFVTVPMIAPLLMYLGWDKAGYFLYSLYAFTCHQLPQRSYFLFGDQLMYDLPTIHANYQITNNALELRQFIGNAQLGWKMAWSDRMVSMYGGIWLFATVWLILPHRIKPRFPFWVCILFTLPILADGVTHMISDLLTGVANGFRFDNNWLEAVTFGRFSTSFYSGDQIGSFNHLSRLFSGLLFSCGFMWWILPYIDQTKSYVTTPDSRYSY